MSEGQTHKLVSRVTDIWTDRMHSKARDQPTYKQTDRQVARPTERQTDRQTGRQRDRETGRQTDTYTHTDGRAGRQTGRLAR